MRGPKGSKSHACAEVENTQYSKSAPQRFWSRCAFVQAYDRFPCVVETAQNATHARDKKILSTPKVPHSASGAGVRSCKRTIDFHAWSKRLKMPRMRGCRKYSVLQKCPTALLEQVCVRASVL